MGRGLVIYGIDEENQWVYFSAMKNNDTSTQGFRIKLDGQQLTCLTPEAGSHSLRFNDSFSHFIHTHSSTSSLSQSRVCRADGNYLHTVEPNVDDRLKYYKIREPEFVQVQARDGLMLDAMIIKPYDFDPAKKYPVLCHVYSGPQSPTVRNRWGGSTYLWHQMLAQKGYVIWFCDNRSASTKGAKHAWKSHRRFGQEELKDIEDGLSWLKQHSWIDGDRIGIWGWSYGGYMTSYALTHSKSFKAGIAGAPVTDWRNYDAIYTERFMGLPQDNPDGYRSASAVAAADQLHGRLLLIHGTIDDNVHISNTLQLAYALAECREAVRDHGVPQEIRSPTITPLRDGVIRSLAVTCIAMSRLTKRDWQDQFHAGEGSMEHPPFILAVARSRSNGGHWWLVPSRGRSPVE